MRLPDDSDPGRLGALHMLLAGWITLPFNKAPPQNRSRALFLPYPYLFIILLIVLPILEDCRTAAIPLVAIPRQKPDCMLGLWIPFPMRSGHSCSS